MSRVHGDRLARFWRGLRENLKRGAIARRKTSEAPVVGRSGSSVQRKASRALETEKASLLYSIDNENDPFMGKLDEICLYEKALSEAEVLQNMEAEGLSVNPAGKLSLTWGEIKASGGK